MLHVKGQLTPRDFTLIEHCLAHLPITSDIAAVLFYPNKYIAQRRLNVIHKLEQLKRADRLVANQPYIYYVHKTDIKNFVFSQLLYDLKLNEFDIETYEFKDSTLSIIVHKSGDCFKINATKKNLPQVYKRLNLAAAS